MTTYVALDDELIRQAVEAGRHQTPRAAVTAALRQYVKAAERLGILDWVGNVDYYDDYDPRALRGGSTT